MGERTVILLASNSPRRRELIALGNWTVGLSVSDVDESQRPGESPADYVLRLAEAKARAALANGGQAQVVLAADTAVIYGPKEHSTILGKPTDAAEAVQMLKNLRGRVHHVYTGLAVIETKYRTIAERPVCNRSSNAKLRRRRDRSLRSDRRSTR